MLFAALEANDKALRQNNPAPIGADMVFTESWGCAPKGAMHCCDSQAIEPLWLANRVAPDALWGSNAVTE